MESSQESEVCEPIDLESEDKAAILFEFAGLTPLSISSLTSHTLQNRDEVESLLHQRFDGEILLDSTDFLRLSEKAKSAITSESKDRIRTAKTELEKGVDHFENEDPKSALPHLERAATILVDLEDRFDSVNYHPEALDDLIERAQEKHDEALREDILDSISHQSILANQHHESGDEHRANGDFDSAVTEYEIALESLEQAAEKSEAYENQRLSEDTADLDVDRIRERISTLEEKIEDCSSPLRSTSNGGRSREKFDIDGRNIDDEASQLRILEEFFDEVGRVPSRDDLAEVDAGFLTKVESNFRTLERAVEQSSIDHTNALIQDVKQVGDQVGEAPTKTVFDQHGTHEADQILSYFGQWSKVLEAAEYSDEPRHGEVNKPTAASRTVEPTIERTRERVSLSQIDNPDEVLTWEDISNNERLKEAIPLEIVEIIADPGPRKSAILIVEDAAGKMFSLNLWEKHPNPADWTVGETYTFENLRGTVWSADGKIKKLLDSTTDISVGRLTDVGEIGGVSPESVDRGGDNDRIEGEFGDAQSDEDEGEPGEKVKGLMDDFGELL